MVATQRLPQWHCMKSEPGLLTPVYIHVYLQRTLYNSFAASQYSIVKKHCDPTQHHIISQGTVVPCKGWYLYSPHTFRNSVLTFKLLWLSRILQMCTNKWSHLTFSLLKYRYLFANYTRLVHTKLIKLRHTYHVRPDSVIQLTLTLLLLKYLSIIDFYSNTLITALPLLMIQKGSCNVMHGSHVFFCKEHSHNTFFME